MQKKSDYKWRTVLGLILIYLAMWFNWQWVWGFIFMIWVIPDILSGVTYFMERIKKSENPFLYWTIIISWVLMSLYSFATLFFPDLNNY